MSTTRSLIPVLALFITLTAFGADELEFFLKEEPIVFRLEAPISDLRKQRGENPQNMPGTVAISDTSGQELLLDVQIKARGNSRRKKSSCSFLSYWINFKKKQVKGTVFDGLKKVKVVAHCREGRKPFDPYIYKEYLTYRTYNLLTDQSFRVRLATIEYVDTNGKYGPKTHVAFMIEPVDDLARRLGATQVKDRYILPDLYDAQALCRAELFEYFIGNTDFSFFASADSCCHNGKTFALEKGDGNYVPVPYDFDMTGLVDVPYGTVNPRLPIKKLTDRFYRGLQVSDELLRETLDLYVEKREEIFALWNTNSYLSDKEKRRALEFIEEFYDIIDEPGRLEAKIKRRMRSPDKLDDIITQKIEKTED